ncbi:MAG: AraC family transcriptional regulator [Clostridia bacterium]|nr:AraC family transcriptional regulator [Clostridia bacterium]
MSNMTDQSRNLKYPQRENAVALVGQNGVPFKRAIIGITYPISDYSVRRPETTVINLFEYVLEGEGEVLLRGKWQRVQAGDMYILRQGEEHVYRSCADSPMKKIWINYTADYMPAFMDAYGIESGIYRTEHARRYFDRIYDHAQDRVADNYVCLSVAECIHGIIHSIALEKKENDGTDVYKIREALNAAIYEKLSLDQLAAQLHISKSNIIRVFKKHYGITPYEYLIGLKIDTAKLLLKNTQMTIGEIAERVQISDQHYFSSLFLSRVGVRPKDYRAGLRKTD